MRHSKRKSSIPGERIERPILFLCRLKVMLDADLALLYCVSTKALNQAVKRNRDRFPSDFIFQPTSQEKKEVVTVCDYPGTSSVRESLISEIRGL